MTKKMIFNSDFEVGGMPTRYVPPTPENEAARRERIRLLLDADDRLTTASALFTQSKFGWAGAGAATAEVSVAPVLNRARLSCDRPGKA